MRPIWSVETTLPRVPSQPAIKNQGCQIIEASVGQRLPWIIHTNGFFNFINFFLGIAAASLMAEKINVGMAVVMADITYMCGFGSDEAAAHLSA